MGAQLFVGMVINAFAKSLFFLFSNLSGKGVCVMEYFCFIFFCYTELIGRDLPARDQYGEIACFVFLLHREDPAPCQYLCSFGSGKESLDQNTVSSKSWT